MSTLLSPYFIDTQNHIITETSKIAHRNSCLTGHANKRNDTLIYDMILF